MRLFVSFAFSLSFAFARLSGAFLSFLVVDQTRGAPAEKGEEALAGSVVCVVNESAFSVFPVPPIVCSNLWTFEDSWRALAMVSLSIQCCIRCSLSASVCQRASLRGETFFHTKTNCVFANLKFVVETLIPKRYPEVIVVVGIP